MPADTTRENPSTVADALVANITTAITNARQAAWQGLPEHDQEIAVAEGVRNLTRVIANAQLNCMENDPRYPYLVKTISLQRRTVLPGADTVYHSAVLHGDYDYCIRGQRGSAHIFELEVWRGHHADLMNFKFFKCLDTFTFGPGEEVDIHLGRKRGGENWLELPEGECTVLIRQYYYDWENEQPALLSIEREGAEYPPPPIDMKKVSELMGRMADLIRTYPLAARHGVSQHLAAPSDTMHLAPVNIGFKKLRYMHGQYLCQPDEAIIVQVIPPKARFWNFQLCNLQWEAIDYHQRQTSINGHQAHLNSDGGFRMVISHQDPGISNWLDTSGRTFGLISGRYYEPENLPIPTVKKVAFKELRQHLPDDMVAVSKAQRQDAIRRRMLSTIRRLCGD